MKTVCDISRCTGCMACADSCPKDAIRIEDTLCAYNAVIDETKCVDCGICHRVCQVNFPLESASPISWKQGWAEDAHVRAEASSGGLATAISRAFTQSGGVVFSCVFQEGRFRFDAAHTPEETAKFCGSKYVKSDPSGVYPKIRDALKDGKKVLFIGLPCQVAAVKKYVPVQLQENLFTIDLICHGTPSPKVLSRFLDQYHKPLSAFPTISFRKKTNKQIFCGNQGVITNGVSDCYTIAFFRGLTNTENCYRCPYARLERVSDLTLGDSWGSSLPEEEIKRGVSLALCQTAKGEKLLQEADLMLLDVDLKRAVDCNDQLRSPASAPAKRPWFFRELEKGKKFNRLVLRCFPKESGKQAVKTLLIRLKLRSPNIN